MGDGGRTWLSTTDCELIEPAPEQVITLQVRIAESDELSATCCSMVGNELVTFNDLKGLSLDDVRAQLEDHLKVSDERLKLVLPDGRLMAKAEGGQLSVSDLLVG